MIRFINNIIIIMAWLMIKLPDAVTDTTMEILYPDSLMSKWSLFLFDPSHPFGESWTEIVNGGVIKNIAHKSLSKILGTWDETSLAGTSYLVWVTPSTAIVEKTSKKWINVIISKTNSLTNLNYKIDIPPALKQYIFNNLNTKSFYFSYWGNVTRISDTNTSAFMLMSSTTSSSSNRLALMEVWSNSPAGNLWNRTSWNVVWKFMRSVGKLWFTWTAATTISWLNAYYKIWPGGPYGWFEAWKSNSMILYRIYIEDLDVSGRTYAEVDAIDKEMYDAAFWVGGKYENDTYTSVTTLP